MDSTVMYKFSYGLFVLTAQENGRDNGCIINTAVQVTSNPNRITIAVNKQNHTHDLVHRTGQFSLSVLSEEAEFDLIRRFGFQSGRDTDKFAGFDAHVLRGENGLLHVTQGTNAFLDCRVVSELDLGTHTLFLADVEDGGVLSQAASATYAYYQQHIKPQGAASAAPAGKTRWVCRICGYVYEGEELPPDFICPICKHPASDFEKVEG